jgi:hypothetical protein
VDIDLFASRLGPDWRVAKYLYSKKHYEQVFEPLIADLRWEYYEPLKEGDEGRA